MTMTTQRPESRKRFFHDADALKVGAALQIRPDAGLLKLTGSDRTDFLQRMTTNDIGALRAGQAAVTILTSPTARTLFVFTVLCRSETLWLLPARGETEASAASFAEPNILYG